MLGEVKRRKDTIYCHGPRSNTLTLIGQHLTPLLLSVISKGINCRMPSFTQLPPNSHTVFLGLPLEKAASHAAPSASKWIGKRVTLARVYILTDQNSWPGTRWEGKMDHFKGSSNSSHPQSKMKSIFSEPYFFWVLFLGQLYTTPYSSKCSLKL